MTLRTRTINEIVASRRDAGGAFLRYGIDYYRIGHLALWQAAARQNVDIEALAADMSTLPMRALVYPDSARGLIDLIDGQFRTQILPQMRVCVRLAGMVEARHGAHPQCPAGLAGLLSRLNDGLVQHQTRDALSLYPAMLAQAGKSLCYPVLRAMAEHDDLSDQLSLIHI